MRIRRIIVMLLGTLCCASGSLAGLTISVSPSGQASNVSVQTVSANRFTLTVSPTADITSMSITGDGDDSIDWIEITTPIGITTPHDVRLSSITGIVDLGRLERIANSGKITIVNLEITGNLGLPNEPIHAHDVNTVTVDGGSILGDIINPGSPDIGYWGIIETTSPAGDIRGDIINEYGIISVIFASGDIISSDPNDPVVILSTELIDLLQAANFTNVLIGDPVGTPPGSDTSRLGKVYDLLTPGDFTGNLNGNIVVRTRIDGDAVGNLVIRDFATSIASNWPVVIGGSLTPGSSLILPRFQDQSQSNYETLQQIIINNWVAGDSWAGEVWCGIEGETGSIQLENPDYSTATADIKGGAVGQAPYRLHGVDSSLEFKRTDNGATATLSESKVGINQRIQKAFVSSSETISFVVQFFGHVIAVGSVPGDFENSIMRVERRVFNTANTGCWENITPGFQSVYSSGTDRRTVLVRGPLTNPSQPEHPTTNPRLPTAPYRFFNGYEYRVKPLVDLEDQSTLRSQLSATVSGSTAVVGVDPCDAIVWCVGNNCPMDFNGDNEVDGADLSVLLSNFGQSIQFGDSQKGDTNGDNLVNGADLSVLLAGFGRECVPCADFELPSWGSGPSCDYIEQSCAPQSLMGSSSQSAAQAPVPPILDHLGFTSIEVYIEWVESLTPEELTAHIADLLSIIAELEQSEH